MMKRKMAACLFAGVLGNIDAGRMRAAGAGDQGSASAENASGDVYKVGIVNYVDRRVPEPDRGE